MPVNLQIKLLGADQIIKAFEKAPQIVKKELKEAMTKAIIMLQGAAITETPVDTGRLRSAHQIKVGAFESKVYNKVQYASFVHDGTSRMRARPFYEWAKDKKEDDMTRVFEKGLDNIIKKIIL